MYLTALRGVFIIGPPEPRLLRRLNREWEDPPMIGYTGPIRCLRLYRTVILPRYSTCAWYPYLRCSILFLLVPWPVNSWKSCRNKSLSWSAKTWILISMKNYYVYLVFRKIVFAHTRWIFPLIIYICPSAYTVTMYRISKIKLNWYFFIRLI